MCRSEAVAASTERSAVLSEAFTKGLAKLKSSRSSTGSTSSSFEQLGQTLNRLDQITRSVADSTGMSQSQVARIAFGAAGHLGVSTPVAGARATANAEKGYLAGLTADQQRVLGALTSEQLAEFKQFGDRVSRDSSFASVVASDAREARELSSRLNSSSTRSSRAEAGLSDRSAYAERVSAAYERGEVIALDIAQDPHFAVREMIVETTDPGTATPVRLAGVPIKFTETPGKIWSGPPGLGHHTDEILNAAGFASEDIADLRRRKVVQ